MLSFYSTIREIGSLSLDFIWFPLFVWTLICTIAYLVLKQSKGLQPLFHYHLRVAAVCALPLGILSSILLRTVDEWFFQSQAETAFFVVTNPIKIVSSAAQPTSYQVQWLDASFLIGLGSTVIFCAGLILMAGMIKNVWLLHRLRKTLSVESVTNFGVSGQHYAIVQAAFHDGKSAPFTFGWFKPVIVLPDSLQDKPEKLKIALRHELVHIQRKDYPIQLFLQLTQNLFWFHPLPRYLNQEIETFREISCDQEVLNHSDISTKSYASLLFEMAPFNQNLNRFTVGMAVQNSTLKKRIQTMKTHKLHQTSFRQSLAFLLLLLMGITLPIACSDLRGPETIPMESIEKTDLNLKNAELLVNGIQDERFNNLNATPHGMSAILFNTSDKGIFKVSMIQFEGARKTGRIEGREMNFSANNLDVKVISQRPILEEFEGADLWVQHSATSLHDIALTTMPASKDLETYFSDIKAKNNDEEDYFVVVEKMPELIGGMQGIQAKVQYPEQARKAGIEGRVTVQFVVNENGNVENAQIARGIGGGCDEEALEVVKQAQFIPGEQRGRRVRVQYALNINFRLEESDFTDQSES